MEGGCQGDSTGQNNLEELPGYLCVVMEGGSQGDSTRQSNLEELSGYLCVVMKGGCQGDLTRQNNLEALPPLPEHPAPKPARGADHVGDKVGAVSGTSTHQYCASASDASSLPPVGKLQPFLLRFPINAFGMCLGVSSQASLWKALSLSRSTSFVHICLSVNFILWCFAIVLLASMSSIYALKAVFYFGAVRREYHHPVRANFFFAPWITCLLLCIGVPHSIEVKPHGAVWYALMAPILCLEVKIYGQWMSGGNRRLSKVANPSNHLAIVGNFVGALVGASMGLKEGPIFFFAVGLAHYIVLLVTLYQRLPTNEALPKELHPMFFLFVTAPSVASIAWEKIYGEFDYGSKICYFIASFLYLSLAVRINFFRGFRFSLAWWSYTYPMTAAANATIGYSMAVTNPFTGTLSMVVSAMSSFTVAALLVATVIHAFVLKDLFPNDVSFAIAERRPKLRTRRGHLVRGNHDNRGGDSVAVDI